MKNEIPVQMKKKELLQDRMLLLRLLSKIMMQIVQDKLKLMKELLVDWKDQEMFIKEDQSQSIQKLMIRFLAC